MKKIFAVIGLIASLSGSGYATDLIHGLKWESDAEGFYTFYLYLNVKSTDPESKYHHASKSTESHYSNVTRCGTRDILISSDQFENCEPIQIFYEIPDGSEVTLIKFKTLRQLPSETDYQLKIRPNSTRPLPSEGVTKFSTLPKIGFVEQSNQSGLILEFQMGDDWINGSFDALSEKSNAADKDCATSTYDYNIVDGLGNVIPTIDVTDTPLFGGLCFSGGTKVSKSDNGIRFHIGKKQAQSYYVRYLFTNGQGGYTRWSGSFEFKGE